MKLITALVFLISSWISMEESLTVTHPKELVETLRTSQVEVHASPIGFKPRSGFVHGVARIASPHSACSTLTDLKDTEDDVFMMADDSGCLESVKAKSIAETGAFLGLIKRNINNTLYDREVDLVHIPILEVDPQFYDNLTRFINDNPNTPITLIASFQRELKHRIKVDFWLTPTEKHSYQFANQMRGFVTSQARDIYFQPRFVLHSQEQRRQYVGCLSSGRFCPVEVEFEGKTEGINIVKESLRQIIIAEKSMSAWFKYAHYYYRQCLKNMGDKLWEDDNCQVCSEIAMRSANINVTEIQTLYNASFQGPRPEVDMNTVLEEERYLYIQEQLTRYPSVLINKKQYNKLDPDYIQREICFKMHPDVHQQSSECQKLTNPSTFSVGEIFLGAGLVLLVVGLGIFAFRWMINRRIKRELKGDVDRTLQQYYRYMETFEDDDPSQPKPLIPSKQEKKEESNQIGSVELAQIQGKKEDVK